MFGVIVLNFLFEVVDDVGCECVIEFKWVFDREDTLVYYGVFVRFDDERFYFL